MPPVPPERSLAQKMDALKRANAFRAARGDVKRAIAARKRSASDVLSGDAEEFQAMKVYDLLCAIPNVKDAKASAMLFSARARPDVKIGRLTDRQRGALLEILHGR